MHRYIVFFARKTTRKQGRSGGLNSVSKCKCFYNAIIRNWPKETCELFHPIRRKFKGVVTRVRTHFTAIGVSYMSLPRILNASLYNICPCEWLKLLRWFVGSCGSAETLSENYFQVNFWFAFFQQRGIVWAFFWINQLWFLFNMFLQDFF